VDAQSAPRVYGREQEVVERVGHRNVNVKVADVLADDVHGLKTEHVELEMPFFKKPADALVDCYVVRMSRDALLVKSNNEGNFSLALLVPQIITDHILYFGWVPITLHAVLQLRIVNDFMFLKT